VKQATVRMKIIVDLSLWSAIKLRISGFASRKGHKVTIQELIDEGR